MTPGRQAMLVTGMVLVALPLAFALLPRGTARAALFAPPAAPPVTPSVTTGKRIALTFDDVPRGPGAFYTPQQRSALLIAGLRRAGVSQVAFFLNPGRIGPGRIGLGRIGTDSGAVARIAAYTDAGHLIADHSWSHRALSQTTAAAFLADVDKAEGWLRGRPGYRPWFRFPGLNQGGRDRAKRQAVLAGLAARGLMVAPVTIDGSDWNLDRLTKAAIMAKKPLDETALRDLYVETMVQSADFSDALMKRLTGRQPAQVILLHETDLAARFIAPLVAALRADGWTIVTADAAFADPVYRRTPDVAAANGTLPEAIALQQRAPGPWYYERNHVPLANRLFAERVLHHPARPLATPRSAARSSLAASTPPPHPLCPVKRHPWRRVCPPPAAAPLGKAA